MLNYTGSVQPSARTEIPDGQQEGASCSLKRHKLGEVEGPVEEEEMKAGVGGREAGRGID